MSDDLKPCPFCGSGDLDECLNTVNCNACGAHGPMESDLDQMDIEKSVGAWNRRAPVIPPEILALSQMATGGEWGIERTHTKAWVGPMRPDGQKVADIVTVFDVGLAYSDYFRDKSNANAAFIVALVNWVRGQIPKEQDKQKGGGNG